jgi:hypothetical protein
MIPTIFFTISDFKMSRRKQNILDEDSYSRTISSIIERDFFPDTELLAVENAYLEAESQNDFETMSNLQIRRKQLANKTPSTQRTSNVHDSIRSFVPNTPTDGNQTPRKKGDGEEGGETPQEEENWDYNSEDPMQNPTVTLNGYLNKNTSEDNYNYHKVLREQDQKKHLAKYRWVYELDNKHRKYVPYATCDSGLGVAAKTKLREEAEKKMIEEKSAMLALGYGEDEIDKTDGEKATEDMTEDEKHIKAVELAAKAMEVHEVKRADASLYKTPDEDSGQSKLLNNWRYMSKNNVMFYRDAIGSKFDDGKFKKPQQICFQNTRFKDKDPYAKQLERMRIEKESQRASAYRQGSFQKDGSVIAADGTTTDSSAMSSMGRSSGPGGKTPAKISAGFINNLTTSDGTPLRTPILTPNQHTLSGAMSIGGNNDFVPSTPTVQPGVGADESPLMTWGTLGTTPVALTPKADTHQPPKMSYTVPQITKRQAIAEKLTEKIKSRERSKKTRAVTHAKKSIFGYTPDRIGSMLTNSRRSTLSPAAQQLINSGVIGGKGSTRLGSFGTKTTPLVRVNKRGINDTPTPSSGGSGGMLAAKLNKLSGNKGVTGGLL